MKRLISIRLMAMCKNDVIFVSILLASYKKYIGREYKGGRLARGQYYVKLNKMTDVADNTIKTR